MIEITGVENAVKGLEKIAEEQRKKLERLLAETASAIASTARQNAPVKTGRLRNSIITFQTEPYAIVVEATEPYAGYVEFGTSRTPARRFMQNAVDNVLKTFKYRG